MLAAGREGEEEGLGSRPFRWAASERLGNLVKRVLGAQASSHAGYKPFDAWSYRTGAKRLNELGLGARVELTQSLRSCSEL